jgi:hypothetical protein
MKRSDLADRAFVWVVKQVFAGGTWWAGILALILAAGCATRIDWAARVGTYTYDQAVLELGPPDKEATLESGSRVAEWLTQPARPQYYGPYGYLRPYDYYGPVYPAYAPGYSPEYWLRLDFGPDGHLRAWKRFAR